MRAPTSRGSQKAVIPRLCWIGPQKIDTLVGSAGDQICYPMIFNGIAWNPYLNLTVDDDFRGNGRIIQFGAVSAPLITNTWIVPNGSHCIYGRVAGGIQADMVAHVAVTLTASRTIPRQGGDNSTVQAASRSRSEPHQTSRFSLDWRRPLTFGARPWACAERSLAKRATCSALCCCMIRNTRCWASLRHAMTFRRWSEVTRASLNCAVQPSLAVRVD
jgi:hypothetical protein